MNKQHVVSTPKGNVKFTLIGSAKQVETGEIGLDVLLLDGNEAHDRLLIQDVLDHVPGMPVVLYEGNTVYPTKGYVSELKKMIKSGDISNMSKKMYEFLSGHVDIAHYDRGGFIATYDGKFSNMLHGQAREIIGYRNGRFTDIKNIFELSGLMSEADKHLGYSFF